MENERNERKEKNAKLYDRLVLRENLILSVYPDIEQAPESIQDELMEIHYVKQYLKNGVSRDVQGEITKYNEKYDVYVKEFVLEKFNRYMEKLENFKKENRQYISIDQEETFEMPSKDDTSELLSQLSNMDASKKDEYYAVRSKIADVIRTSTWDDSIDLSNKLFAAEEERNTRIANEKRAQRDAYEQHLAAFRQAQERYSQLSIFGKLKSIIQKKDIRHIDARDFSTEELNNMYVTSGRTK